MASRQAIDRFLARRRLAVVGVSREPRDFSRAVLRAFTERGYDVVAVNPAGGQAEGKPMARAVGEIQPPVEAAFLLTPAQATERVVRQCAEAGVRHVWMHRGAGRGAVSGEAVAFCRSHDIEVVDGACPFMFLPGTGFGHRVHRFFVGLAGRLPS